MIRDDAETRRMLNATMPRTRRRQHWVHEMQTGLTVEEVNEFTRLAWSDWRGQRLGEDRGWTCPETDAE